MRPGLSAVFALNSFVKPGMLNRQNQVYQREYFLPQILLDPMQLQNGASHPPCLQATTTMTRIQLSALLIQEYKSTMRFCLNNLY